MIINHSSFAPDHTLGRNSFIVKNFGGKKLSRVHAVPKKDLAEKTLADSCSEYLHKRMGASNSIIRILMMFSLH